MIGHKYLGIPIEFIADLKLNIDNANHMQIKILVVLTLDLKSLPLQLLGTIS